MKRNQQGFTLIELMIVVAIIAILAAIAIPLYLNYTAQAEGSEALSLAGGLQTDIAQFYSENGHYPLNNESAGAKPKASISGKYVAQVEVNNGLITAQFKSTGVATPLHGAYVYLAPSATGGSLVWKCGVDNTTMYKYVPGTCRNPKPSAAP